MYKELNNINTSGLLPKYDAEAFMNFVFEKYYTKPQSNDAKTIQSYYYKDNGGIFKTVNPTLKEIIGVYPLSVSQEPLWKIPFINMVERFLQYSFFKYFLANSSSKYEIGDNLPQIRCEIINTLNHNSSFVKGVVMIDGREIKILKYLKSKINQICKELTNANYERMEWYKYYTTRKESGSNLHLVLTNSVPSLVGMSSFAPIIKNGDRLWRSCMAITKDMQGNAPLTALHGTIDPNSLIAYVTNGTTTSFYGEEPSYENSKIEHFAMDTRWMLRGMRHPKTEQKFIVLDRAYRSDMYTMLVLSKLQKITEQKNIKTSLFSNYNFSQEGKQENNYNELKENKSILVSTLEPMPFITIASRNSLHYQDQHCTTRTLPGLPKTCSVDWEIYDELKPIAIKTEEQPIIEPHKNIGKQYFMHKYTSSVSDIRLFKPYTVLDYNKQNKKCVVKSDGGSIQEIDESLLSAYEVKMFRQGKCAIAKTTNSDYMIVENITYEILYENNKQYLIVNEDLEAIMVDKDLFTPTNETLTKIKCLVPADCSTKDNIYMVLNETASTYIIISDWMDCIETSKKRFERIG